MVCQIAIRAIHELHNTLHRSLATHAASGALAKTSAMAVPPAILGARYSSVLSFRWTQKHRDADAAWWASRFSGVAFSAAEPLPPSPWCGALAWRPADPWPWNTCLLASRPPNRKHGTLAAPRHASLASCIGKRCRYTTMCSGHELTVLSLDPWSRWGMCALV
jgi:hypothetical protein